MTAMRTHSTKHGICSLKCAGTPCPLYPLYPLLIIRGRPCFGSIGMAMAWRGVGGWGSGVAGHWAAGSAGSIFLTSSSHCASPAAHHPSSSSQLSPPPLPHQPSSFPPWEKGDGVTGIQPPLLYPSLYIYLISNEKCMTSPGIWQIIMYGACMAWPWHAWHHYHVVRGSGAGTGLWEREDLTNLTLLSVCA